MSIEMTGVTRTFAAKRGQPGTRALDGVDLTIESGELFGILGPNGAGKTTLVRILTTLLTPSSGTARVEGLDVVRDMKALRRRIGVAFGGERGLYDRLTARDNLIFAAHLYDLPRRRITSRVAEVLEAVDLESRANDRVETFSRGMKQRMHIARALVHDPSILFLDEPTSGLDPVAARSLRELTKALQGQGKTILMTTHEMFEADALCGRVAILAGGRLRTVGTPAEIKGSVALEKVIEVELHDDLPADSATLHDLLGATSWDVEQRGSTSILTVRADCGSAVGVAEVIRAIPGVSVGYSLERTPTLEDAYIAIVEKDASEVAA